MQFQLLLNQPKIQQSLVIEPKKGTLIQMYKFTLLIQPKSIYLGKIEEWLLLQEELLPLKLLYYHQLIPLYMEQP